MSSRGKHLLEAFKTAGPNTSPPAASSGGAAPTPSFSSPSFARPSSPSALVLNGAQLRLIALVVLLLMVVSFLIGRVSVRGVAQAASDDARETNAPVEPQAAPRSTPPPAAANAPARTATQPPPSAPPQAPALDSTARTVAEQALLDPANIYTIKLVHYSNTEVNKRLAAETARYVQQTHNLPAVVAADASGLFILVGAAPRQVELDDYLARIKRMSGPPPLSRPAEFHSAYVDKIDKLFRRQK